MNIRNLEKSSEKNIEIRYSLLTAFNNFIQKDKITHINKIDKTIEINLNKTKKIIKSNPDILITKADKGNVTVIMNKIDYLNKVESALTGRKYYSIIKKSPLNKLQNNILSLI